MNYKIVGANKKERSLSLDGRIPLEEIADDGCAHVPGRIGETLDLDTLLVVVSDHCRLLHRR